MCQSVGLRPLAMMSQNSPRPKIASRMELRDLTWRMTRRHQTKCKQRSPTRRASRSGFALAFQDIVATAGTLSRQSVTD